ncbi:N-acetyltransferase [Xylanibacillus composti]|uniref:N-acetyltransferase n=1 Tax=Xylanibacillus composti TaxID=1572762 RepID=A0A8J4H4V5_9BACL|nr:GNAT family protein [Xylanibacillus composti]GIQ69656.1 N-acetyltransferase [Xylanibacillus composti]
MINIVPFPVLETERCLLRQMKVEDAADLYQIFSDAEVTKDMGIDPLDNIGQAEGIIHFMNQLYDQKSAFRWGIIRKADGKLIGTCGYNGWEIQRGSRGEIAYDLGKAYWRQGYMSEVLQSAISFGFDTMSLHRIEAFTNMDAVPSMKLLERMGFKEEGILRGYAMFHGQFCDQRCYSLLKLEWNS